MLQPARGSLKKNMKNSTSKNPAKLQQRLDETTADPDFIKIMIMNNSDYIKYNLIFSFN